MAVGVIVFPGSNCERDTFYVIENVLGAACHRIDYRDTELSSQITAVVLPGGFSYGDYLRPGALAAMAPVLLSVKRFAEQGGKVVGICNGFQILCEAQLLPGVLLTNHSGKFICKKPRIKVTGGGVGLLKSYQRNETIELPVAHHDGAYCASEEVMKDLVASNSIALIYDEETPSLNGSLLSIAGIFGGPFKNILGLMPHPERCSEPRLGGVDGLRLMKALIE